MSSTATKESLVSLASRRCGNSRLGKCRANSAPYGGSVVTIGDVNVNVDANAITDPEAVAQMVAERTFQTLLLISEGSR